MGSWLVGFTSKYKLFADTCSLMGEKASDFFIGQLLPILSQQKVALTVPLKVIRELENQRDSSDTKKKNLGQTGLDILWRFQSANALDVRGNSNEPFADDTFQYVFTRFRTMHNLALITQDRNLAIDIQRLNFPLSVKSRFEIRVYRITRKGTLGRWRFTDSDLALPVDESITPLVKSHKVPDTVIPKLPTKPRGMSQKKVKVENTPTEGDSVKSPIYGALTLQTKLGQGAEGVIYRVNRNQVCKVFYPHYWTEAKLEKIELMLSLNVDVPGIIWPLDFVRNSFDQNVGYLMPLAEGKPLAHILVGGRKYLESSFPHWNRRELVTLCLTILSRFHELHLHGILIGDINLANIMVKNEREISVVDIDSCQIGDIPGKMMKPPFISPEYEKQKSGSLRTWDDEHFALATLLFMIMLPGQSPYAYQGGGSMMENLRARRFPYPCGERSTGDAPRGPWRFIWSHLPFNLKEMLYGVFAENKRYSASEWLEVFNQYNYQLGRRWHSNEIQPRGFKLVDPIRVVCTDCGLEKEENKDYVTSLENSQIHYVCWDCRDRASREFVYIDCSFCGEAQKITRLQAQKLKRKGRSLQCEECVDKIKTKTSLKCVECGGIDDNVSILFFEQLREQNKPFVCRSCREQWFRQAEVKCEKCNKKYNETIAIIKRIKDEGKQLVCPKCRVEWTKVVKEKCTECGKKKEEKQAKLTYLKQVEKPFICKDCRRRWFV